MGATFEGVYYPKEIEAMSLAYEEVCYALRINGDARAREIIATRIVELAGRGECCPTVLRDRVLAEAGMGANSKKYAHETRPQLEFRQ